MDRLEEILRERLHLGDVAPLVLLAVRTAESLGFQDEAPREEAADRIYSPPFYDAFATACLAADLPDKMKARVADLAFDLVQLPGTEREAFVVFDAIPQHLPTFAAYLSSQGKATSQHLLTLIYGLFHRALVPARLVERRPEELVAPTLPQDVEDRQGLLYALLLCSYPGVEEQHQVQWFRACVAPGGLHEVIRGPLAAALRDRASFRLGVTKSLAENSLGNVDFDLWPHSLPMPLRKAAAAWAPL